MFGNHIFFNRYKSKEHMNQKGIMISLNENRRVWLELIVVFSIGVFPDIYRALLVIAYPEFLNLAYPENYQSHFLIARSIGVSIPVLYIIHRSELSFSDVGLSTTRLAHDLFIGILIFIISYITIAISLTGIHKVQTITGMLTEPGSAGTIFQKPKTTIGIGLLVIGCILNGFAEELVMRGYFIERLEKLFNSTVSAVIISAILFTSYHTYQPVLAVISILIFGLIYGYIYTRTRKIWPLAIAHAIHNLVLFSRL